MLKTEFIARPLRTLFTDTGQFTFYFMGYQLEEMLALWKGEHLLHWKVMMILPLLHIILYILSLGDLNCTHFLNLCTHPLPTT